MNCDYADIRSAIDVPPTWWDERAVPRYCDFAPNEIANIYARECALLAIQCQGCGHPFRVAMSFGPRAYPSIDPKELHYGDPPNVGCCPAGPTMNSEPTRVLEFWLRRDLLIGWVRCPEKEIAVEAFWTR